MARGVPMQETSDGAQLAASGAERREKLVKPRCDPHELTTVLRDLDMKRPDCHATLLMARTTIAIHVASHNCDYYITKYSCKTLEQLANLVTQYALGIRRLEE